MTVKVAPEFWVAQGPATDVESAKLHTTAAAFRRMLDGMYAGRQGVVLSRGTCQDLKVTATGADVNITVAAGACFVRGTQATDQGMYHVYNDAALVIPLLTNNPANASNPRIDLVVARMQDQQYSGAVDVPTIEMVTGVPGASPAVPAAPANSLILAQILIPAASTVVAPSNITDRRPGLGYQPVLLDEILVGTDARYPAASPLITFLNASGVGTNLLPPGFRHLFVEWYARGDTAGINVPVVLRFNNDSGANYDYQLIFTGSATALTVSESLAATYAQVGYVSAATATAGYFGHGSAEVHQYAGAVGNKNSTARAVWSESNATAAAARKIHTSGKWRTAGAPITRLDVLPTLGNFVVGSHFALWGFVPFAP